MYLFFFFNDPATTEIYTLSLHDALPICGTVAVTTCALARCAMPPILPRRPDRSPITSPMYSAGVTTSTDMIGRSEEHTSELQSRRDLVCRLLLEKKKKKLHSRRDIHLTS